MGEEEQAVAAAFRFALSQAPEKKLCVIADSTVTTISALSRCYSVCRRVQVSSLTGSCPVRIWSRSLPLIG